MGGPAVTSFETESDRRRRLAGLIAEGGAGWEDRFRPGSFGCHELLDRTALAANTVEQFVLSHPSCVRDPEWFALAERAASALWDLYRRVGEAHLDDEFPGPGDRRPRDH